MFVLIISKLRITKVGISNTEKEIEKLKQRVDLEVCL